MTTLEKITRIGAIVVIWVLMLGGVLGALAVPVLSAALTIQYAEYANDFWVITVMLEAPVAIAVTLLAIILVLLRRIRIDRMFTATSFKWVSALSYDALVLAVSFAVILIWLNIKNTLPPLVGMALLLAIVLPLAVSLVTRTLLGLLKKATAASVELEAVI
jgi:hypothetical protein